MKTAEEIRRNVLEELEWSPGLDEAGIGVSVAEGVVTLTGHVPTFAERAAAERAAKRVAGVRGVANDLVVELPSRMDRDDSDLAHAAVRALEWRTDVPPNRVQVTVADGWITLEGDLEWQFQRQAAFQAVSDLPGVRGVNNLLRLTPRASAFEVERKIREAYERSASVDARHVHVEIEGDGVVLRGTVRSWSEYEDAERAAWAAPGIARVENLLKVEEPSLVY